MGNAQHAATLSLVTCPSKSIFVGHSARLVDGWAPKLVAPVHQRHRRATGTRFSVQSAQDHAADRAILVAVVHLATA
jgi:hypothetical protein